MLSSESIHTPTTIMNTFGTLFTLTSFGESHGLAIGGVVDGMPPGISVDIKYIQSEMCRRRPGQSAITTGRSETDEVEFLSGIFEGKTTGTPIGFVIRNTSQHSADYDNLRDILRPSHADFTYQKKYGVRDHRGGGRSSARETATRCVAGALAKLALREIGISIQAYTSQVGHIALPHDYTHYDLSLAETNAVRCPDPEKAHEMEELILRVKSEGDTIGGIVTCVILGCPVGLGEPVFGKLHAALGNAMLSINACKGFDYGRGFEGIAERGSEQNDPFITTADGDITPLTNRSGGIQGGISNGKPIYFRAAFKPVATQLGQQTVLDIHGTEHTLTAKGRHDPCVVPRAVPIVEAMAAITILDYYLQSRR